MDGTQSTKCIVYIRLSKLSNDLYSFISTTVVVELYVFQFVAHVMISRSRGNARRLMASHCNMSDIRGSVATPSAMSTVMSGSSSLAVLSF